MSHPQPPVVILRDRKRNAAGNRWLPLTALTKRYRQQHRESVVGRPAPAEAASECNTSITLQGSQWHNHHLTVPLPPDNITAPSNLWQGPQNRRSFVFRRRVLTGIIRRTVAAIVGSNNGEPSPCEVVGLPVEMGWTHLTPDNLQAVQAGVPRDRQTSPFQLGGARLRTRRSPPLHPTLGEQHGQHRTRLLL